ncbi:MULTISPECIES: DUF4199 domain-containing protein [unclassified Sphingopyxis]|uniref:DUF4199 domain-containing protein n=1 Tax=unclassified Sphingopyxis TaxID=2614943 RepID=UPI0024ADDF2F|nr:MULTISPECIES: DUF4199 domain-containing protein [unclassified Sphingopyxis]
MGRIIAVYGAIAGVIVVAGMFINIGFLADHGAMGMVAGYLSMLVALIFVFVGVKRYRDVDLGGVIGFWKAFGVGIGIGLVAGLFYVLGWELYMWRTGGTFMAEYIASSIEDMRAAGKSAEEIAKFSSEMGAMAEQYKNPLFRMALTLTEILPVALIVSLVSAALLRRSSFMPAVQPRG